VLEDEAGNKTRAAQRLGLARKTLSRKLDEYARARGELSTPTTPSGGDPE
jgi:DNA-binding NtrC family response regulator